MNIISESLRYEESLSNRDETKFHPSEATNCQLAVWFLKRRARGGLEYTPVPFTANQLMIFRIGHLMHEWVQQHYLRTGICCDDDIEHRIIDEKRGITGSVDILIPKEKKVIDLKTCSWNSFTRKIPKYEHKVQTSIYAHYVGAEQIEVHYIAKDSGRLDLWIEEIGISEAQGIGLAVESEDDDDRLALRIAKFEPEPRLVFAAFQKFAEIEQHLQKDTPPAPEFFPTEPMSPCKGCPWRYECSKLTGRYHPGLKPRKEFSTG